MRYLDGLINGAEVGYDYFCLMVNKDGNICEFLISCDRAS
jgi:hypothetical protein